MRTTLTIDDDLLDALKSLAHQEQRPFKDVVNDAIRAGLAGQRVGSTATAYRAGLLHCGLRPGVDPERLNQLVDDLDVDERRP